VLLLRTLIVLAPVAAQSLKKEKWCDPKQKASWGIKSIRGAKSAGYSQGLDKKRLLLGGGTSKRMYGELTSLPQSQSQGVLSSLGLETDCEP